MKLVVALSVLALAAAGCGSDDADESAGGGDVVEVGAVDFAFEPSTIELGDGATTVELTNEGEFPHALVVEDTDAASETIDPGDSTELTLELEPGSYTVYCPVGDHRERGMEGTLTVGGGGLGAGGEGGGDDTTPDDDSGYGYG